MWQWDVDSEVIVCEANMARDRHMFRVPQEGRKATERLHTGEQMNVASWQWPGDPRVFLVPAEMFQNMALAGLIRDVIASTGQMYRDQHYPQDLMVRSSLRRIADSIGLSINGNVGKNIDDCLAFARMYTVKNQDIITKLKKDGTVASKDSRTYGYIDMVSRATMRDGRIIPRNKQWYEITLSQMYASGLRMLPSAPLPVAALEAAHAAPRRIIPTIKNLAYYLAGRVPQAKIKLLLPTIREIAGLAERRDGRTDKTRRTLESALEHLHPVMVDNFRYDKDGYIIILSGKPEAKKTFFASGSATVAPCSSWPSLWNVKKHFWKPTRGRLVTLVGWPEPRCTII